MVNDLSIRLDKRGKDLSAFDDTISLERISRKSFHGRVKKGKYVFKVLSGPSLKDAAKRTAASQSGIYKDVIPQCAVFQLSAHLFSLTEKDYNEWNCKGVDFTILPETLNTIDRLGLTGQEDPLSPEVVFAKTKLMAPDSSVKDARDSLSFTVDFDYFLRLSLQPSSAAGMRAVIKQGSTIVAKAGGKQAKGADVNLGAELKQHQTYTLDIYHYPEDSQRCSTYALTLEMRVQSAFNKAKACSVVPLTADIVHERQANFPTYMFEYSDAEGTSTQALDPVYSYSTSSKPYSTSIPFTVTADRAMVSGYLQSSFVESGLILEILDSEGTLAKGQYENAHRYELAPIELEIGDYTAVIREATNATTSGLCVVYSAFLLKEDAGMWDSFDSLLRKTKSCKLIDQFFSLNTLGQLEDGKVFWKKEVPLNVIMGINVYELEVKEASVLRVQIEEYRDVTFSVSLLGSKSGEEAVLRGNLKRSADVVDGVVEPGSYFLEIIFDSDTQLPSAKQCPSIQLSVLVLPKKMYDFLAEPSSCTQSNVLPTTLSNIFSGSYNLNTAEALSKEVTLEVAEESEIVFKATYIETLSGAVALRLFDENGQLIARGNAVENFNELREVIPEGIYKLLIETPASSLPGVCFDLTLEYSASPVDPKLECLGAMLPPNLWSKDTSAFGGPQAKDSQISFYGRFKASGSISDSIAFKITENSLFRALFNSELLNMSLSVFDSKYSEKPLAFTWKNSDSGSFIVELKPQSKPYQLVVAYNLKGLKAGCPLFDLKLAIEPVDSAQTALECKAPDKAEYLPATSIEFYGSQLYKGTYYILDKWVLRDAEEFPSGVKSQGKPNEPFVFESKLHFNYPGVVSTYARFDFLTNDISIMIRKEGRVISGSEWGSWGAESETLDFSQGFEGVEVEEGDYTLTLKQSIASNHLVQMFDDVDVCFPFEFEIEYEPDEGAIVHNRLLMVEPGSLSDFNPANRLTIVLKFQQPLSFASKKLVGLASLVTSSGTRVAPSKARVDPRHKQHLSLEFEEKALVEDTCYDLIFELSSVSLSDAGLPLVSDNKLHSFCTAKCKCNSKAKAACDSNLQCICPFPYTGPLCYECEDGFQTEKSRCVPIVTEEGASIPYVVSVDPQGSRLSIQKNDDVTVKVALSSKPHTQKGEFITKNRNIDVLKGTFLLERAGQKKPERYSPYKASTNGEFLEWTLTYRASDLRGGVVYNLVLASDLLYDAKGLPFRLSSGVLLPSFTIEQLGPDSTDCSGRGTWTNSQCDCDDGYAGDQCDTCEEGWLKASTGECKMIQKSFTGTQPKVESVNPPKQKIAIARGATIKTEVKLSTKPYTKSKLSINSLINTKHLKEAFYLHRTGKLSDVKVKPKAVEASNDNLTWTLIFDSAELTEGVYYRLAFTPDILHDVTGLPFVCEIEFPSFGIPIEKISEEVPVLAEASSQFSCPNGILFKGECVCDVGYTGLGCKECFPGFDKDGQGRCVQAQKQIPQVPTIELGSQDSMTMTLVYTVVVSCFCFFVIYQINKYRSGRQFKVISRQYSGLPKEEEQGIDLHSTKFDSFKFNASLEDEDDY